MIYMCCSLTFSFSLRFFSHTFCRETVIREPSRDVSPTFERKISEIANDIPNDKVAEIGLALGFSLTSIDEYKIKDVGDKKVARVGTRSMLRDFYLKTPLREAKRIMFKALETAGLQQVAERHLGKKETPTEKLEESDKASLGTQLSKVKSDIVELKAEMGSMKSDMANMKMEFSDMKKVMEEIREAVVSGKKS